MKKHIILRQQLLRSCRDPPPGCWTQSSAARIFDSESLHKALWQYLEVDAWWVPGRDVAHSEFGIFIKLRGGLLIIIKRVRQKYLNFYLPMFSTQPEKTQERWLGKKVTKRVCPGGHLSQTLRPSKMFTVICKAKWCFPI